MIYERVKIARDPHTVYNRDVLPWEVPILEFMFEGGNVQRQDETIKTDRPYPDANVEYQRLTNAYGADPQSGVPYAASVYGQASAGVNHLRRAIADAKAEFEPTAPSSPAAPASPEVAPAKKRGRPRKTVSDPLLG